MESELARAREALVDVDRERDGMLAQLDDKVPSHLQTLIITNLVSIRITTRSL